MNPRLTFHLIPHTHWDREWYLPLSVFQARLAATAVSIVDLLDREPGGRFVLDGQAVLLDDAAGIVPGLDERFRAAASRGQLDIGPWYVLADEMIPSGESLVRNLLEGVRVSGRRGPRMNVCYSPDAFGHPAALPAIAAQFGIEAGVVWRGLAPDERGDVDLRLWRGPDGAEILLYHLPRAGYEIGACLTAAEPRVQWAQIRNELVRRAATPHVAVFVGADHHAPPTSYARIRDAVASAEPDHDVRVSSLSEFFAAINGSRGALGAVEGELRWSYGHTWTLQGVHGTRTRMKRHHSAAELLMLRRVEPIAALARLGRAGSPALRDDVRRHVWRELLAAQFHDTLAGTVIDEVAREQAVRLTSVMATGRELFRDALDVVLGHDPDLARHTDSSPVATLCLWNPVPRRRGGITVCDLTVFRHDVLVGPPDGRVARHGRAPNGLALRGTDGSIIPVQVLARDTGMERIDAPRHYPDLDAVEHVRVAFESPTISGFGFCALTPVASPDGPTAGALHASAHRLGNAFVTVTVGDTGRVTVEDHRTGEVYPDLLEFDDECDCGDTYTPHVRPDIALVTSATPMSHALRAGPLVATVEVGWRMQSAGTGDMLCHAAITLHADSPLVRIRYRIDNCATNHRLRARLPVGAGERAVAGAAFGMESRPAVDLFGREFPDERPVATAPAHRFVAAGVGVRGLVVMQPGFFEYEWTADADLHVTLIRSVGQLSLDALPTRPGHAAWPTPTPEAQEPGWHTIDLAVVPVDDGDLARPDLIERLWAEAFVPIEGTFVRNFIGDVAVAEELGVSLRGEGLVFSAMKPAEKGEGIILRCYNVTDRLVDGEWEVSFAVARATLVRLDETPGAVVEVALDGCIRFTAPPRGIVSIEVHPGA